MFKCKDISRHASDYQDAQLGFWQRLQFALHLLICGNCREFMRQFALALAYYRSLADREEQLSREAAEELAGQVIARAESEQR